MKQEKYFCDKCNKEVGTPKDLRTITIGNGGSFDTYSSYNRFEVYKKFDLCVDCQKKVGVEIPTLLSPEERKTIEERLFGIVEELVLNAMPY